MKIPKAFRLLALSLLPLAGLRAAETAATLTLHADQPGAVISPYLYGQFTEHLGHCIYGGIWVEPGSSIPNTRGIRNDVVAALRAIHVPVVRWPGGCFAEEYHWRNGIGPLDRRPAMINNNWGGVTENNHFGTHEFLDFCEQVGCEPYLCGNLGSGTVKELSDWIEYMTSDADAPLPNERRANGRDKPWRIRFFAFGNESWGCGGNMRPEYYSDVYRRYANYAHDFSGNKLYRIAVGPTDDDYHWTETLTNDIRAIYTKTEPGMDALALHHYTIPIGHWADTGKGSATKFGEDQWHGALRSAELLDEQITKHLAIMDRSFPKKNLSLVVDEWGIWTDAEPGTNPAFLYQQNSLRDAIVAAVSLHIMQAHADRVSMANIAQMVNVLQAMILTDGPKILLTPTYHLFEMFQVHQGATALPVSVQSPDYTFDGAAVPMVSASASRDSAGRVHLSLVNTNPHAAVSLTCKLDGLSGRKVSGRILTAPAMNSVNTFAAPDTVVPRPFEGATLNGAQLGVTLPAMSVVVLTLE